jgi:hypothetical protein
MARYPLKRAILHPKQVQIVATIAKHWILSEFILMSRGASGHTIATMMTQSSVPKTFRKTFLVYSLIATHSSAVAVIPICTPITKGCFVRGFT